MPSIEQIRPTEASASGMNISESTLPRGARSKAAAALRVDARAMVAIMEPQ